MRSGSFEERNGRPIVKYRLSAISCAKTAEPIEMPFGMWTQVGPRKDGVTLVQPGEYD